MDTSKIIQLYVNEKLNIKDTANAVGTSEGKVKRFLKKNGLTRTKGEAQALALKQGRAEHPTSGKKASQETKIKMSAAMHKAWVDLPEEEKEKRSKQSAERWANMSDKEKEEILSKAAKKVRETSKNGSKLERFLVDKLRENGYTVLHHCKHTFSSNELEMDLMLPDEKIIIEVDGPSHFLPLYGEEVLQKRMEADNRKSGIVINSGWKMIRICYMIQNTTKYWFRTTEDKLVALLKDIKSGNVTDNYLEVKING